MGFFRTGCFVSAFLNRSIVTDSLFIMASAGSSSRASATVVVAAAAAASQDPNEDEHHHHHHQQQQQQHQAAENEIPLLPEPDPDSNLPSIKLGETISFEEMGPVIINADGMLCILICSLVI